MAKADEDELAAGDDADLPLIPKAPRLPSATLVDDAEDAEPTYSLRPKSLPRSLTPEPSTYSLRPPAVMTAPSTAGYSLRPPSVKPSVAPTTGPKNPSLRPPRGSTRPPAKRRKGAREGLWSRRLAFFVSLLFAIVGLVPLAAALLVRTPFVQRWASERATTMIEREVGARATFRAEATLWPLSVKLRDVEIESDDGGAPFVEVDEATVSPRLFSLISGRLDAGEVEIVGIRSRVVIKDGELVNFRPVLPESDDAPSEPKAPFRSLSVTDVALDLTVDDVRAKIAEIDVDVSFGQGLAFELALRASRGTVTWTHENPVFYKRTAVEEDRLCGLELRSSFDPKGNLFTVRRFSLKGSVDFDPAPNTRPACELAPGDWRELSVELASLELPLSLREGTGVGLIRGRANAKLPIGFMHRFLRFPHTTGSIDVDLQAERAPFEDLPRLEGRVGVASLGLDGKVFADRADLRAKLDGKTIVASDVTARWGDGDFRIARATIDLADPKMPLVATDIEADNVELQGLLRDLGAHPQSHVGWRIDHVTFDSFGGTLAPVNLEGVLDAETSGFGVYDRPSHRVDKRRMISVDRANVTGNLAVRADATYLERMHAVTPASTIFTSVKLGYDGEFGIEIGRGTSVDFGEVSPLVSVPVGGVLDIEARGIGTYEFPRIEGDFSIASFMLGGFKAGDIRKAHAVFVPLNLELTEVEMAKNKSVITSPRARIDFDGGPDVLVDAEVDTRAPPSLEIRDFFEVFQFHEDPRFEGIGGVASGTANVHYAVGGPEDKCGTGALVVKAQTEVASPTIFGETFDRGSLAVDFKWDDSAAGGDGMQISLPSIAIFDGPGSVIGEATVSNGRVRGSMFGSGLPIKAIEGVGRIGNLLDGEISFIAELSGTLARLAANIDVSLSPLRFGSRRLPGSRFGLAITPDPSPPVVIGRTTCDRPIGKPFDRAEYDKDLQDGTFTLTGGLFGGQVELRDVVISKQRAKVVRGTVGLVELDIGTIAAIHPTVALTGRTPNARLSGAVDVRRLELENLGSADVSVTIDALALSEGGRSVKLASTSGPIRLADRVLDVPDLGFVIGDGRSKTTLAFSVGGSVTAPLGPGISTVDAKLEMTPFSLAALKDDLPQLDRIEGMASGSLAVVGDLGAPKISGNVKLRDGSLALVGFPTTIEDIAIDLALGDGELRITKARANVGAGTVDISGRIPVEGLGLGTGSATITGRGIKLPAGDGIDVVVDTDLDLTIPATNRTDGVLPDLRGKVDVTSFAYTRPISLSGYIGDLTKNLGRAETVTAVDPDGDFLSFSLLIDSQRPLRVENELAEIQLEFVDPGITLSGTNQKYGARGALRVLPDSKLRLRNHEFDVSEGFVRFDDPAEIRADIDVRASTELRRYAQTEAAVTTTDGSSAAGQWDVKIHAHGTIEELKLDLTSEPSLAQEDILLLLTIGMTRAEVDRGLTSSLDTLGLEALSTLSGADKAVQSVIPIIDYFHFGSTYSSRTGRIEPTVTIGKRLTDDLRANVTTTLTEQDVAATLEWRLRKGVSVEASYDNTNDIGTIIGNLGLDLRWRLEFE